jgi:hypothetical protein
MMSARSTPNLQQHQQQPDAAVAARGDNKASIYSYLHNQSGLNFTSVVQQQTQGATGSPPPAPPVRDPSSLKCVKYGPGHEKFPSWPVSAAADTPQSARSVPGGGSHRSKSWTDHTNYPKEKAITYTRPYMKRPNAAFTQQVAQSWLPLTWGQVIVLDGPDALFPLTVTVPDEVEGFY